MPRFVHPDDLLDKRHSAMKAAPKRANSSVRLSVNPSPRPLAGDKFLDGISRSNSRDWTRSSHHWRTRSRQDSLRTFRRPRRYRRRSNCRSHTIRFGMCRQGRTMCRWDHSLSRCRSLPRTTRSNPRRHRAPDMERPHERIRPHSRCPFHYRTGCRCMRFPRPGPDACTNRCRCTHRPCMGFRPRCIRCWRRHNNYPPLRCKHSRTPHRPYTDCPHGRCTFLRCRSQPRCNTGRHCRASHRPSWCSRRWSR
jgi:hypothetical protein